MVESGLSLCSLHHKAFDLGAIAISDDHKVLVSRDVPGRRGMGGPLPSGQRAPLVGPQAGEPPVGAEFAWHRKAVYRGPHRLFGREVEE